MFLVGRGLTDWLLQDAEHGMFPPPHAVPSLAGTAITDRTVMARMKIAEYNAPRRQWRTQLHGIPRAPREHLPPRRSWTLHSRRPLTAEEAKDEKKRAFLLNFYY